MSSKVYWICFIWLVCLSPLQLKAENKQLQVVLRQIGHRLLLSGADSTSRVLPVKKINTNTYEISFEKEIRISADTLYSISKTELYKAGFRNFVAELKECNTREVYLSFLYSQSMDSITPCGGRDLPIGCYKVEIMILPDQSHGWMMWLLIPLLIIPVATYVMQKNKKVLNADFKQGSLIPLGSYQLDLSERKLLHPLQNETLTDKEARLLTLLLRGMNEVQNRDYLMEQIWAESGLLVVSKNLDVLISKIRKKLSRDDRIKIINVHGVGYKLEVSEDN